MNSAFTSATVRSAAPWMMSAGTRAFPPALARASAATWSTGRSGPAAMTRAASAASLADPHGTAEWIAAAAKSCGARSASVAASVPPEESPAT